MVKLVHLQAEKVQEYACVKQVWVNIDRDR